MARQETTGERLVALESRLDHLESDVTSIRSDVRELRDAILQGKGSWKTAAALLGLAGAVIVGLVSNWFISIFETHK